MKPVKVKEIYIYIIIFYKKNCILVEYNNKQFNNKKIYAIVFFYFALNECKLNEFLDDFHNQFDYPVLVKLALLS
jgi:hypothetical protein